MKKTTLYALEKLNYTKIQRFTIKNVRFRKKPSFYALKKLTFAEIQRYTVWKR